MKKIIIGGIVILILAGAAPFVNGLLMEKTVQKAVEDANTIYADTGADYSVQIVNYKRGFLSSEIEWKVNLGSFKAIYGVDEVIFRDHAKHGYTKVVSTTNLEKNPWFKLFIEEKLNGYNPFKLTTTYSVFGDIQSTFSMDAFTVTIENETLDVKEGRFVVETDAELRNFKTYGNWIGFNVDQKITLGNMDFDSDLRMLSTYLWDGKISFNLDSINIKELHNQFECVDLKGEYEFSVDQTSNLISGETFFSVGKLLTPTREVNGANIRFSVDNLSAQSYETFMQIYTQTMSEVFANVAAMEESTGSAGEILESQMTAAGLQMVAAYEKLLQQNVEFKISDLLVKLPEGDISGELTLRLLKNMTLMQFAPVVGQPDLILDVLYLKSQLRLPVTLVGEVPMLLDPIYPGMQTGIFIKDGEYLEHRAETKDGTLLLNGEEFNLNLQQQ